MPPPLIACHHLSFAHGRRQVLENLDLEVLRGERIGIIGPNGAGKTTLLHLLVGCLQPKAGEVLLDGKTLRSHSPEGLARRMAVVPQAAPLAFGFQVMDVVAMGRHPHLSTLRWRLTPEDRERVHWAMTMTGTIALADRRFNQLSGGEQQLVLIARALAQSTEMLLLDEPTASLDLHHQAAIIHVLNRLHREEGSTIIWIAHDLNLVGRASDRLVLLCDGRIAAVGTPEEILTSERLSEAYKTDVRVDATADGHRRVEIALGNGDA